MFRKQWSELEGNFNKAADEIRNRVLGAVGGRKKVKKVSDWNKESVLERKEEFVRWGKDYVDELKKKAETEKVLNAKENFFVLLRNLGINDEVLRQTFEQNRKEILDPVIGETVALVSLILGWSQKDKESFSQALGEIGVAGVFAAKPFICLIAICGLAWGYQEIFHSESFKKGGVLGLAGVAAVALTPGGFAGLLAAIVTMVYLNKKLMVDRPIETQLKEIFVQIKNGEFFKEVRGSWKAFEEFLSKLLSKNKSKDSTIVNVSHSEA